MNESNEAEQPPKESTAPRVGVERIVMCKKCGSNDILTRHIPDDELIDSSSSARIDNEFIYSSEYQYYYKLKAKKEHLHRHCRNCQYDWRVDALHSNDLEEALVDAKSFAEWVEILGRTDCEIYKHELLVNANRMIERLDMVLDT